MGFEERQINASTGAGASTYVVIGLGNPGREYRGNRHNFGYLAIDQLCDVWGIRISRMQSKALIGTGNWEGNKIILAKPQTFMNLSGQAVLPLVRFYKIPLENLIIIHDDLDLPFGTIRMRPSGGAGGQRGLASIIQQLSTQEFPRLRLGIGRPPGQMDAAAYVLQDFSKNEQEILSAVLSRVVEAVQMFVKLGVEKAMTHFNGALPEDK